MTDNRLTPYQRKYPVLWQLYLTHQELTEIRKAHTLRLKSIERGKSSLQGGLERMIMDMLDLDAHVAPTSKKQIKATKDGVSIFQAMVEEAEQIPIYHWLMAHKGIGESLSVKLIALIDDISKFDTVAKLWRYAGYGLYQYWQDEDGKIVAPFDGWKWVTIKKDRYRIWTVVCPQSYREYYTIPNGNQYAIAQNVDNAQLEKVDFIEPEPGWKLVQSIDKKVKGYHCPFNSELKSLMFNFSDSFVKMSTPEYRELYDSEKTRQLSLYPEMKLIHAHNRALRKLRKELLKQLWVVWREFEGLEV